MDGVFHDEGEEEPEDTGKEPVDPLLLQRALERIKAQMAGNGIDPDTVTLENFTGEVLHFGAYNLFTIKPSVAEKSIPGKELGEVCGSAADLRLKITAAIEKTTDNPEIADYLTTLLARRKDKGFMADLQAIKLDRLAKKFIYYNSCTNCSSGKMLCMNCQGTGDELCPKCKGHGKTLCNQCRGAKTIRNSDGKMGPCRKCNGHGRMQCILCRSSGKIKCTPCQGSGRAQCPKCAASGIISEIAFVTFEAENAFIYDSETLPPDIPPLIDQLGPALAVKEHADIQILGKQDQQTLQRAYHIVEKSRLKDGLLVPYHIRLPWGEITFAHNDAQDKAGDKEAGTLLRGKVFGFHPRLLNLPPFLEKPLAPGLDRLTQAANNLGPVRANMIEALRFRAIGDALIAVAILPPKKASQTIRGRWALGLTPDVAHKMVQLAEKAVQNLTRKARIFGLLAGLTLSAGVFALYLIGPLRGIVAAQGLRLYALLALDLVLIGVAGYATIKLSQLAARRSLILLLETVTTAKRAKKILPRAGHTTIIALIGAALVFVALLIVTALTGHPLPEWAAAMIGSTL